MVMPDAGVWIDYFNGVPAPHVDALLRYWDADEVATTDVIIMEVLQGFRFDRDYESAKRVLGDLIYCPFWGRHNMELAASNYRALRKQGVTIRKPNDMLIGTLCIKKGYRVLHNDQDFELMERFLGLRVVH